MSLTTHSPQEPLCPSCGAFADWSEVITELLKALGGLVSKPAPFCEDEFGDCTCPYCDWREHLTDCEWLQAQHIWVDIKDKVRSLLPEERREDG